MRFIAAALVLLFHSAQQSPFSSEQASKVLESVFGQGGWTGVGFFFILSGFVLTWSARPTDTVRRFWRRRIAKVYPNHLATFLLALAILVALGQGIGGWETVINLFLFQAWFPQLDIEVSVNPVAWSLSCEMLFYLLFPLVLRLVDRIPANRLWHCFCGLAIAIGLMPVIAWSLPTSPAFLNSPVPASQWEFWFVYALPPVRMLDFLMGIVLARIVQHGRWIGLRLGPASVLAAAAYVASGQAAQAGAWTFTLTAAMAVPLGLLVAAGAHADVAGGRSLLRSRSMLWLGNVSFGFYMIHYIALTEVRRLLGGQSQTWGIAGGTAFLVLAFATTLLGGWLLYRFVEEPAMRRWGGGRSRPPGSQVPVRAPLAPETVAAAPSSITTP
ncbi:acyltransferase [Streptomyces sp. H27-C3]|uniref:acyltransferase family protein n=1 Tax=Streptomyces sp. H27-C3 TaxID=3046305 RepID=UPI0024B8DE97|nr:acyltransferase [Streptomyces sp. H27-C3]MDJ0466567.1 acyltransferase [Streptomyces sp. H27-C3]